jgi:hypothetical protein
MDDDAGTKYITASRRLSVVSSVPILLGLFIWLYLQNMLAEFPTWLFAVGVIWTIYASYQGIKYYKRGFSNYYPSETE